MAETKSSKKAAPAAGEQRLSAMLAPCPPLPEGEIGRWTEYMHYRNLIDFVNAIETARAVWRKCPQLVEAKTLDWVPAEMWEAFLNEYPNMGYEDHQLSGNFQGGELLDSDYPARVREQVAGQMAYNATQAKPAA